MSRQAFPRPSPGIDQNGLLTLISKNLREFVPVFLIFSLWYLSNWYTIRLRVGLLCILTGTMLALLLLLLVGCFQSFATSF